MGVFRFEFKRRWSCSLSCHVRVNPNHKNDRNAETTRHRPFRHATMRYRFRRPRPVSSPASPPSPHRRQLDQVVENAATVQGGASLVHQPSIVYCSFFGSPLLLPRCPPIPHVPSNLTRTRVMHPSTPAPQATFWSQPGLFLSIFRTQKATGKHSEKNTYYANYTAYRRWLRVCLSIRCYPPSFHSLPSETAAPHTE